MVKLACKTLEFFQSKLKRKLKCTYSLCMQHNISHMFRNVFSLCGNMFIARHKKGKYWGWENGTRWAITWHLEVGSKNSISSPAHQTCRRPNSSKSADHASLRLLVQAFPAENATRWAKLSLECKHQVFHATVVHSLRNVSSPFFTTGNTHGICRTKAITRRLEVGR